MVKKNVMETRKHFELSVHEKTTYIEICRLPLKSTQGGNWQSSMLTLEKKNYKLISQAYVSRSPSEDRKYQEQLNIKYLMKQKTYLRSHYNLQTTDELIRKEKIKGKTQITNIKNRKGALPISIFDSLSLALGILNLQRVH